MENGTKFIKDVVLMKEGILSNKKPSNGNEPKQKRQHDAAAFCYSEGSSVFLSSFAMSFID